MKRVFGFICLLLCACLLFGCIDPAQNAETPAPETAAPTATPQPTATPAPTEAPATEPPQPEVSLSWAKAFRISTLPEGEITPDEIAFYWTDENQQECVVNVAKDEVFAYQPARLPRTRSLEQYIPDNLDTLLITLDYALAHGYSRVSIPTTEFNYGDILSVKQMLNRTYYIDGSSINSLDVMEYPQEDGTTLTYVLVTLGGIADYKTANWYREGVAAAEAIVDSIPEGSTEFQTALYLYQYLTDNVTYDYNDYYAKGKQVLLYDALVKHKTVCAGYAEALYYLYSLAGLDCMVICGYISDQVPGGSHAWNIARIDGQYYQFDATWDEGTMPAFYHYFGISDEEIASLRKQDVEEFSQQIAPECPVSLFPQMTMDYTETVTNEKTYAVLIYYMLLDVRESDPERILSLFGIEKDDYTATESVEEGWMLTSVKSLGFRTVLCYFLEDAEADRFCEGVYEDWGGKFAFHVRDPKPVGVRVTEIAEQKDGTVAAVAYRIDHTGAMQRVEHVFRIVNGRVRSCTEN